MYKRRFSGLPAFVGASLLGMGICSCNDDKLRQEKEQRMFELAKKDYENFLEKWCDFTSKLLEVAKRKQESIKQNPESAQQFVNSLFSLYDRLLRSEVLAPQLVEGVLKHFDDMAEPLRQQNKELVRLGENVDKTMSQTSVSKEKLGNAKEEVEKKYFPRSRKIQQEIETFIRDFCKEAKIDCPLKDKPGNAQ